MAKELTGKALSTKMKNTIVVAVEKKYRHPKYHKVLMRHKRYKAHNEGISVKVNDMVKISESRPISKQTNFIVIEKLTSKA